MKELISQISIRPIISKFGKQSKGFQWNETNHAGPGEAIMSRSRDKLKALYYQSVMATWLGGMVTYLVGLLTKKP